MKQLTHITQLFDTLIHFPSFRHIVHQATKINMNAIEQGRGPHRILSVLANNDKLTNSEIAEKLDIRPSSVSNGITLLEEKGYVERIQSEEDRRVTFVAITQEGKDVLVLRTERIEGNVNKLFANLDEKELKDLEAILEKLVQNISEDNQLNKRLEHMPKRRRMHGMRQKMR